MAVGIFLFLISGFWRLQVQNPQFYQGRAQQNRIKSVALLAPRGRILDRDGRVIVDSHASFALDLARENLNEDHLNPSPRAWTWTMTICCGRSAATRTPSTSPYGSRKSFRPPTWHLSPRTTISSRSWN